uniref:Uncharacterized protein n=1 Tax=Siphoviridae sp. ctiOl67 TaxID=2825622 RepID=A0A8S5QIX1_9CAUD|nr:MAG TPA: hypothetical protein [Siphoviridae sp. ctiOl67]
MIYFFIFKPNKHNIPYLIRRMYSRKCTYSCNS